MTSAVTGAAVWTVGAGGLLGSAVNAALGRSGHRLFAADRIPWNDSGRAAAVLEDQLTEFMRSVQNQRWGILWCAGAGVTGTSKEQLQEELIVFRGFLDRLRRAVSAHDASRGLLFLASSAGGAYGGSSGPPFDEFTEVRPISPYGRTKLAMEDAASVASIELGLPFVAGRIANIYGPGQNLAKSQGLISQLCRAAVTAAPLELYADPSTLRDYLFVDDCAAMIVSTLWGSDTVVVPGQSASQTKVYCSGTAVSIDTVLDTFESTFGSRAPVVIVPADVSSQILDLRLASRVATATDGLAVTSLADGLRVVMADVERRTPLRGPRRPSISE